LLGKVFAIVDRRRTSGEERVYYHDEAGKLCRMNAQLASVADVDPFVLMSAWRSRLRVDNLLQLVALIEQLRTSMKTSKPKRRGSSASSK